jgi:hypothetical protein
MNTNILRARNLAAAVNYNHDLPVWRVMNRKKDGLFGDDSDYTKGFWRVGGNAVVYECGGEYRAARWHEFLQEMKTYKIFVQLSA